MSEDAGEDTAAVRPAGEPVECSVLSSRSGGEAGRGCSHRRPGQWDLTSAGVLVNSTLQASQRWETMFREDLWAEL